MRLGIENTEGIEDLSPFINWVETPGPSLAALLADHPDLDQHRWSGLFSRREKAEGDRKSAPAAFRAWFLGRLAAKAAAGRMRGQRPEQVEITKGPEGRPELPGGGHVSISHTLGAAVAAAGREPLGVDLERPDRRLDARFRRWAFTDRELELAEAAPPPWPGPLALWCAREAGAKAWGRGLLNHLDRVRVGQADWPAGRLRVDWLGPEPASTIEETAGRRPSAVWVDLIEAGGYLLALAGADRQ